MISSSELEALLPTLISQLCPANKLPNRFPRASLTSKSSTSRSHVAGKQSTHADSSDPLPGEQPRVLLAPTEGRSMRAPDQHGSERADSEDDVDDADPRAASVPLALAEGRSMRRLRLLINAATAPHQRRCTATVAAARAPSTMTAAATRGLRRRRAKSRRGGHGAHGGQWCRRRRVATPCLMPDAHYRRLRPCVPSPVAGIQPPSPGARVGRGGDRRAWGKDSSARDLEMPGRNHDALATRSRLVFSASIPA